MRLHSIFIATPLLLACGEAHSAPDAGVASDAFVSDSGGLDAGVSWRWDVAAPMAFARSNRQAVLLQDGRVLVAGGDTAFDTSMVTETYDPLADEWTLEERFRPTTVGNHTVTVLPDGRALITSGGIGRGENLEPYGIAWVACWLFDPVGDALTTTGEMLEARSHHAAALLESGEVLAVGGAAPSGTEGEFVVLSSAERYDPATETWAAAAPASVGRYWHTLTPLEGGELLLVGGADETRAETTATEIYSPTDDRWTVTGSLDQPRQRHSTVRLASGEVLAIGGLHDSVPIASVEAYSPATGEWTSVAPLPIPLADAAAVVLLDGRVLITGGYSDESRTGVDRTFIYDRAADAWREGPSLHNPRYGHSAIVLQDGRILVLGGFEVDVLNTATTEITSEAP